MALTLVQLCQTALREIGNWNCPSAIVANSSPDAVQLLALINRTGREVAYTKKWQELLATHTFPTVASTADYAAGTGTPSDFKSFANLTFWDRTNIKQVRGPVSPQTWEALRSGSLVNPAFQKYFRIAGGTFSIYPTPDAVETVAYQYYSKYWIAGQERFAADSDTILIDEDLVILGLRWRWLDAKGLAHETIKSEYYGILNSLEADNGGRDAIIFGPSMIPEGNIPEAGYGS